MPPLAKKIVGGEIARGGGVFWARSTSFFFYSIVILKITAGIGVRLFKIGCSRRKPKSGPRQNAHRGVIPGPGKRAARSGLVWFLQSLFSLSA
jgi:hypothetical protein